MGNLRLGWRWAMVGLAGVSLASVSPAGAVVVNGVQCNTFSLELDVVNGVLSSNSIIECDDGTPNPTPTPGVGPTPPPGPTPTPGGGSGLCPQGFLNTPLGGGWGRAGLNIPAGTVLKYCANLEPPQIPPGVVPSRVTFSFYDESDRDCGALTMSVQQISGAQQLKASTTPLANGSLSFTKRSGRTDDPARVAQGTYVVTVAGHPTHCTKYLLTWGWQ